MELKNLLTIFEVIISICLIIAILLQQKEGGLGNIFGGVGGSESYRTKRGLELFLTNITIILIVLFIINTLVLSFVAIQ